MEQYPGNDNEYPKGDFATPLCECCSCSDCEVCSSSVLSLYGRQEQIMTGKRALPLHSLPLQRRCQRCNSHYMRHIEQQTSHPRGMRCDMHTSALRGLLLLSCCCCY
eukprot:scaffold4624_cov202-Prasinococcus_capsulatus_cf.AAC.1